MPQPENGNKIKSFSELRKEGFLQRDNNLLYLQNLADCLEEMNTDQNSHLYDKLGKHTSAIRNLKSFKALNEKDCVKTLNEFAGFLMQEKGGKTNYQRLLDDAGKVNPPGEYNADTIKNGLNVLKKVGFDIDFDKLEAQQQKLQPDLNMERRKTKEEKIATYEQLLEYTKNNERTIFEYDSKEYKAYKSLYKELDNAENTLSKRIENNAGYNAGKGLEEKKQDAALLEEIKNLKTQIKPIEQIATKEAGIEGKYEEFRKSMEGLNDFLKKGEETSLYQKISQIPGVKMERIDHGFKTIENNLHLGIQIEDVKNYTPRKPVTKNALDWIDGMKNELREKWDTFEYDVEDLRNTVSKILAARILVDSIPGEKESLKKPVSDMEIEKKAAELRENDHFEKFLTGITNDGDRQKKIYDILMKRGHGGRIEQAFTKFLNEQPAGWLHNDAVIERFMPRVIDRIESLQHQIDHNKMTNTNTAVAEAFALRNMINVGRDQKEALKVKIPANGKLTEQTVELSANEKFTKFMEQAKNKSLFQKGHGGLAQQGFNKSADGLDQAPKAPKVPGM